MLAQAKLVFSAKMKQEICSLYLLKAIGAIAVVLIHTTIGNNGDILHTIANNIGAVSIFFAITGYFLYSSDDAIICSRLLKTARKVIPVLLTALIVYQVLVGPSQLPSFTWENKMFYFKWFILCDAPNATPLWYLGSLVWGCLFLYLFIRAFGSKYTIALIPLILLTFAVDEHNWMYFFKSHPNWLGNPITSSIPMIPLGMLLHRYEAQLLARTNYLWWSIGLIISMLALKYLSIDDLWLAYMPRFSPWTLIPIIAPIIFLLCALQYKHIRVDNSLTFLGKHLSANIYYWHFLFVRLLREPLAEWHAWEFFYILPISIFVAWIIYKIQKQIYLRV